jgi:hypothetical protein
MAMIMRQRCTVYNVQPICTHTINVQKCEVVARVPYNQVTGEYRELIGSEADIYQTVHDGRVAFLVVADKKVDNCCAISQNTT